MDDAYLILGVACCATPSEIKTAWRSKARACHPDCCTRSSEDMAIINAAYDCLKDPQRRARYDAEHGFEALEAQFAEVWNRFDDLFADLFGTPDPKKRHP